MANYNLCKAHQMKANDSFWACQRICHVNLLPIRKNCCQVESHKQAVSKSRLSVSIVPTVPLASRLAPCSHVHPVPLCFTGPPTLFHISTSLFSPSFAWCELWQTLPTLLHSTLFHFLPLARWPGCPAGATCSPPGQLACLMVPFIRPYSERVGGPS